MKKLMVIPLVAAGMAAMVGCSKTPVKEAAKNDAINLANLDTAVAPGTDFYQYACGGWMKNNPLKPEYARFGTFDQLRDNNQEQIRTLIEGLSETPGQEGSVGQKIGMLFAMGMDSVKLNEDGYAPIKDQLAEINKLGTKDELTKMVATLHKEGMAPFFALYVGADEKNSSMNIVQTYQGGIGMGQRDYYLENDEQTKSIRDKYKEHLVKMFQLAGYDEATAQKAMVAVMNIETRLAKAARSQVELRDPHANYNKMDMETLKKNFPTFNWDAYFTTSGLNDLKEVNVGQPAAMKEVADVINTVPLEDQKFYLQWNLIDAAASFLSDDFVAQNFDFYSRTMSGKKEMQPRWKRAVSTVDGSLGEVVGQMYVKKYSPAAAKERMVGLVKNLQTSLGERIKALEWMSEPTKVKALEKLATFHVKIGYPDKWKDYSALEIKDDSYWANIERASQWDFNDMIAKAGKPVDKDEWLMTPQTVNAYYNPTTNEICFPAAILQAPFFDMNADDAMNYGAIGVVIGHEMTHGFDDQGRQYDKDGNLKDWWTEEDAKKFEERAQVMVNFFDSIEVAPGVHGNGELTLGENIADHGGLQVSFTIHNLSFCIFHIMLVQPLFSLLTGRAFRITYK